MNTPIRLGLIAAAGLLPTLSLRAEPAPATGASSVAPEAKPYVLFMSTDVAVERNQKLYPIKDVSGRDFIVSADGHKVSVPMTGGGAHRIEFQHALTLARTSASLTGLNSGRAYTPGNDPVMQRQIKSVEASAAIGDNASLAEGQALANANGGYVIGNIPPQRMTAGQANQINNDAQTALKAGIANGVGGLALAGLQSAAGHSAALADNLNNVATATAAQQMDADRLNSTVTDAAFARLHAEEDRALELFDAVEVRFEVASAAYLEKPYVVVITRFHTRDDKPGVARNAVYAKALNAIGAQPTKVELLHGGFPPGFEIEDLQVHLYNEGKEIPTEVAQKRVPLSRDEAFEYLQIDYFRGHKDDTLPATPAVGRPDRPELTRLGSKQSNAVYYVKVDKKGRPGGAYVDEDCSQPADVAVAALAGAVRYYPALEHGKTVDGVAHLVLSHLEL